MTGYHLNLGGHRCVGARLLQLLPKPHVLPLQENFLKHWLARLFLSVFTLAMRAFLPLGFTLNKSEKRRLCV